MINISLIYPADPAGAIPGEFGIDSFIRNLIRFAPDDIRYELIGITTEPSARPVGKWTECMLGEKRLRLFPVLAQPRTARRSAIPLSLRFSLKILLLRPRIQGDLLEFHRIEPSIAYMFDKRPKNAFIHQDMKQLLNPKADIVWRHMPFLYYKLEDILIPRLDSLFTVSEAGRADYLERFSFMKERIFYTRTFMNPEIFYPAPESRLLDDRRALRSSFGLTGEDLVCVFVGRLDQQKDPLLLVEAFSLAAETNKRLHLLLIGDGVLRDKTVRLISEMGRGENCLVLGLMPPSEIAKIHRGADLFLLSSAYEGMPIALLEAMACGLPAVATAVGEVPKIIKPGINGELVNERNPVAFARALEDVLAHLSRYRRKNSIETASAFNPQSVLEPVYRNYRNLIEERGL
jgi:glycosyltransferase involved in cell wall biosynthesis